MEKMAVDVLFLILVCLSGVHTDFCSSNPCIRDTCVNEADGYICTFCKVIPAPENGDVSGSAELINDVVQFTCNQGYQLIGRTSLRCQATGTWDGVPPTCNVSSNVTPTSGQATTTSTTDIQGPSNVTPTSGQTATKSTTEIQGPSNVTPTSVQAATTSTTEIHGPSNVTPTSVQTATKSTTEIEGPSNVTPTSVQAAATSTTETQGPSSPSTEAGPSYNRTALIATVATVCVVVLLGIVAAVMMYFWRKRKSTKTANIYTSQPTGIDNMAVQMVPVDNDNTNDNSVEGAAAGDDNIEGAGNDNNIEDDSNDGTGNVVIYDNVPANTSPLTDFTAPIPRNRLEEVYNHRHSNQVFREEYQSISRDASNPRNAHMRKENEKKNRFTNVFTYDHSRVVLTTLEDQPGTDYINANYIDGYKHPKKFIAAQGPLPGTIEDFWRMVWEQDTATVVMVTNLIERNIPKCAQYWPTKESTNYGDIWVTLKETTTLVDYVIRRFNMQKDEGPCRTVHQYHFTGWPDFGVPQSPLGMMKFIRRVKTENPPGRGPIVVHCSAGVGRTGTFIAIEAMEEMMAAEGRVDVHGFISRMRHNRHSMVQTVDQYVFIYRALLEQHLYGDTEVEVANIHRHMNKLKAPSADPNVMGYEAEFKKLTRIPIDQNNMKTANKQGNKSKNREVSVVPYDTSRVFLPTITGVNGSDYINASFIDGYRQKDGFIATQGPLQNTVEDFWRMVWNWKSYSIVMLTELEENGREKSAKYWPDDRQVYGKISVELKDKEESPGYTLRIFRVSNTDVQKSPQREIHHFQFHDWSTTGVPKNASRVLDLIGQVQKQQMKSGNGPITVHCSNGAGRTGAFIALITVLERVKGEGICDLFQTVKSMRYSRPHMVQTAEQYLFCYKAVMEYLDSFDDYANFR